MSQRNTKRNRQGGANAVSSAQISSGVSAQQRDKMRYGAIGVGIILLVAVFLCGSSGMRGPFVLDDLESIVQNTTIRDFGSFQWIKPPATAGETVSGRPVLNFTFAVNYALGGLNVRGYHIGNLLIHAAAALALFGIVRRTLERSGRLGSGEIGREAEDRYAWQQMASWIALAVALIWAVHPLLTGAVTYVVQRAESLASLFYLLTLYCYIRGTALSTAAETGTRDPRKFWFGAAVLACALGMGTKETVATAPLLVLLYDRCFVSGSFKAVWQARRGVLAAFGALWLLLAVLVLANSGRGGSAGFSSQIGVWPYLLTQCEAIVRYIGLAVWPVGLVFDYGVPVVGGLGAVWWQAVMLCGLFGASVWALTRNWVVGFLGACFFLLLAPSSSFVPVSTQTIAEHRMYLALAVLVTLACSGIWMVLVRWRKNISQARVIAGVLALGVVVALGLATYMRNEIYGTELSLWGDTVAKRPDSARARNNYGAALREAGRTNEAIAEFSKAIELQPNHAFAHFNLAMLLSQNGKKTETIQHYRTAVQIDSKYVSAYINLGKELADLGNDTEAAALYRKAIALDPSAYDAQVNLAGLLIHGSGIEEGVTLVRDVLKMHPELAEAHYYLGIAYDKTKARSQAETEFREAIRLKPSLAVAHLALGNIYAVRGDMRNAELCYGEALRLNDQLAGAWFGWGNVLARADRLGEAEQAFAKAVQIDPLHMQARTNLGNCQLMSGRVREAIATYESILKMNPSDDVARQVRENLGYAREALRGM